jgi:hypothetical protein
MDGSDIALLQAVAENTVGATDAGDDGAGAPAGEAGGEGVAAQSPTVRAITSMSNPPVAERTDRRQ